MRLFWCTKQVKRVNIDDILTESPNPLKPKKFRHHILIPANFLIGLKKQRQKTDVTEKNSIFLF